MPQPVIPVGQDQIQLRSHLGTMLNWRIRYSRILERCPELFDPAFASLRWAAVLVASPVYLRRPVVGIEQATLVPDNPWLDLRPGDATDLAFEDDSFHYVICVRCVEHLPPESRNVALRELARVRIREVWLACPIAEYASSFEQSLAQW